MLDVDRLRLLLEVHRRGTIGAAARAVGYSASAVSQHLAGLEKQAGVQLLERVGRGVRLTPQALILIRHTEAVLETLDRAEAEVAASLIEPAATLRLACFQTAVLALAPRCLTMLRARAPDLRVDVVQLEPDRALDELRSGGCDLALVEDYPDRPAPLRPGLHLTEIGHDPMRVVLPAGEDPTAFRDLAALRSRRWVLEPEGSLAAQWVLARCRQSGFEPDVTFRTDDMLAHAALIRAGHAVGILPDLVWQGEPPGLPTPDLLPGAHRRIRVASRQGTAHHPALVALRAAVRDAGAHAGLRLSGSTTAAP